MLQHFEAGVTAVHKASAVNATFAVADLDGEPAVRRQHVRSQAIVVNLNASVRATIVSLNRIHR